MTPVRATAALFAAALAARCAIIAFARFDGLYGQDSFAYFDYARQILSGQLIGPFYWPLGYPGLAAAFMALTGPAPFGAQLASLITGSAIPPLVYLIARELEVDSRIAFGVALLTALSGQLLQSSISIMSDAPALFWATLSAFALLRFHRTRRFAWLPMAAVALALAIITRWIFLGLIFPFGLFARLSATIKQPARLIASIALFSVIVLPQLLFSQSSAAPITTHGWITGWSPRNALQTTFDNPDGHFDYRFPPVLFYAEPFFHPFYLFPLLTPFTFVGAWQLRRNRALLLLGGWILTLYLYLIGLPYENFRFGLAFFPPIALLAAVGLSNQRYPSPPSRYSPFHCSLFIVSLFMTSLFTARGLSTFLSVKASELAAAKFLQARVPPNSNVLTFGLTLTLDHYTNVTAIDLSEQSPDTLRPIVCAPLPAYLFIETENIESQWEGKAPQINVHWLRDEIGWREIGREGTWTLFAVEEGCVE